MPSLSCIILAKIWFNGLYQIHIYLMTYEISLAVDLNRLNTHSFIAKYPNPIYPVGASPLEIVSNLELKTYGIIMRLSSYYNLAFGKNILVNSV